MKTILSILLLAATAVLAQKPVAEPASPALPPVAPVPGNPTVNIELRKAARAVGEISRQGAQLAQQTAAAVARDLNEIHWNAYAGASGSRSPRSLVVLSSNPDPEASAEAEEDLSVMNLILRKAIKMSPDGESVLAAGINVPVDSSVFGSASGARNIYLEGYGALFLLSVKYPLLPAPEKPAETAGKEDFTDDWRKARDEIREAGRGGYGQIEFFSVRSSRSRGEEYDATKVDGLKSSLLEALKNATHIRAVKPGEYITVVVQGTEPAVEVKAKRSGKGPSPAAAEAVVQPGDTVLTLRVKKSDVDAYAAEKMDFDAFQKKASIQTYFRQVASLTSARPVPVVR